MSPISFIIGARLALSGFGLIRRPGLRRFVVIPLLINLVIFAGLIWLGASAFDGFVASLLPDTIAWLEYLLWPLFALTVLVASFYTFTLVANLVGAPFNDRLSEKVVERLQASPQANELANEFASESTSESGSESTKGSAAAHSVIGDVGASIWAELRKWLYFIPLLLAVAVLWLVGLLVPPLALFVPLLWFALGAWMLGFEYLDYPLGNTGRSFAERRAWLRARRGKVLGFGAVVLGLTMIPLVNFFVMPAAVAGATAFWLSEQPGASDNA